jgi:hypothetical protein
MVGNPPLLDSCRSRRRKLGGTNSSNAFCSILAGCGYCEGDLVSGFFIAIRPTPTTIINFRTLSFCSSGFGTCNKANPVNYAPVCEQISEILTRYGINVLYGDQFSFDILKQIFARLGIEYKQRTFNGSTRALIYRKSATAHDSTKDRNRGPSRAFAPVANLGRV